MSSDKFNILLSKMQRMCSVREYSLYDIEQKLQKEGLNTSEIESLLKSLLTDKFVDDLRFAKAFANDKSKFAGWGPDKIIFSLRTKRVSAEVLREVKESFDSDTTKLQLRKIMEQKLRGIGSVPESDKLLAKLVRFGLSRGYNYGDVYDVAKQIVKFKE
jgi:regulatory protein